ncbi:MAG: methyltransferase domain-containing protein [Bdellovibrionaceae bacterium]|nr:methyltransferase domain-containing protein [Pseudobdellovibrionaceae bacterium]
MLQKIFKKAASKHNAKTGTPGKSTNPSKGTVALRQPTQKYTGVLSQHEIQSELKKLEPSTPWAHYYDFGHNLKSVNPSDAVFFKKATGLKTIGEGIVDFTKSFLGRDNLNGLSVLDLACGEAGHSIEFANLGATVMGVEGRDLYVKRSTFAAKAFGFDERCKFLQSDVRTVGKKDIGSFDITLLLGILHHLGENDFWPMLQNFADMTDRLGFIYTHVSEFDSVTNHRLKGPVMADGRFEGYLFQEHREGATEKERLNQVRASLDNTYSFWAREESLLRALKEAGFSAVFKVLAPHPFEYPLSQYRVLYGCLK